MRVRSSSVTSRIGPADPSVLTFLLYDTSGISEPAGMLILQSPKSGSPLLPLPAGVALNAILARYLAGVAAAAESAEAVEAETDDADQLSPENRRQALLARIETFVERNLGDPDLKPAAIAAHHHISLSYLHRLFQPRDLTVAAWIRRERLERARADLADPRLRTHPVQVIAARWGFRHAADFSRAFRAAHGMPPGDYRHQVLS
jgi:AraC-like DNA-binding protein